MTTEGLQYPLARRDPVPGPGTWGQQRIYRRRGRRSRLRRGLLLVIHTVTKGDEIGGISCIADSCVIVVLLLHVGRLRHGDAHVIRSTPIACRAHRDSLSPAPTVVPSPPPPRACRHADRDDSRQLQRQRRASWRSFRQQCGCTGAVPEVRRRRAGAEQGDPEQGQSAGRCFLRGRQQLSEPRLWRPTSSSPTPRLRWPASPPICKLDRGNRLLPVDFGYVTLNYDKKYFADNGIPLPQSLRDLTNAGVQGPAGGREPRDLVARPGLPAGDRRHLRRAGRLHLPGLLARPAGERRATWPTGGRMPTTASSAAAAARGTIPWW